MLAAGIAFLLTLCGYAAVDLFASRHAGESASLPVGALFVAIVCASMAHFLGWWASVGAFALLAIMRAREAVEERRATRGGETPVSNMHESSGSD